MAVHHYRAANPLDTNWYEIGCREAECDAYVYGWATTVPTMGDLADWIRYKSDRRFREEVSAGGLSRFVFPPGQEGFHKAPHRRQNNRPSVFGIQQGHMAAVRVSADEWVDRMQEDNFQAARERRRG